MKEYIDAEQFTDKMIVARGLLSLTAEWGDEENAAIDEFIKLVQNEPRVDAVEVIRCKDCRNCIPDDHDEYLCSGWGKPMRLVRPNGYCYKGKNN